jgi:hypothetical protein
MAAPLAPLVQLVQPPQMSSKQQDQGQQQHASLQMLSSMPSQPLCCKTSRGQSNYSQQPCSKASARQLAAQWQQ